MFQSKWIRIPLKIILVWLVISIYFYLQHPVTYRYQGLNAHIPVGDAQLLIQEIRVSNLAEDKQNIWMDKEEIPWRIKLAQRMHEMGIPFSWQESVRKILSFYSWPPLSEDYWTFKIYGSFISAQNIDSSEHALDRFSLRLYPAINNSSGTQWEEPLRNAVMIFAGGQIDPQQLDKPLLMTIVEKENDHSTQLVITPGWQKTRHINKATQNGQYKSPAAPVQSFLHKIYNQQTKEAREYVLPELRNNFTLPAPREQLKGQDIEIRGRLNWVDVYEDFLGVYQMETEIGKTSENDFTPVQNLTFYTVLDQDGSHKIIDWESAD